MLPFAFTIFVGAFLLFEVQPSMGKYILPWFGGGPGVWTTCMLFFQVVLLGGYAYAHLSTRWLSPRLQGVTHIILLVAALLLLPIIPAESWKPTTGGVPVLQILLLLTACLGLPYFVLSSTGPLMQQWFSRTRPGASPYRLYALSNTGSLLALVTYPFFFEQHFTRKTQATLWGWGLVAYAVGCAVCAFKLWRSCALTARSNWASEPAPVANENAAALSSGHTPLDQSSDAAGFSLFRLLLWLLLPACAAVLLLAVTNKLCQDVASVPFLWVLPLALYLLSFVICFDSPRWYARLPFTLGLIASSAAMCWALFQGTDLSLYKQIMVYAGGLFCCCMVCHGELYRLRPEPRHLTAFYLMIAGGGAIGGVFVAILAPLLFKDYYELNWGLWSCGLLFVLICSAERRLADHAGCNSRSCSPPDARIAHGGNTPPDSPGPAQTQRSGIWSLIKRQVRKVRQKDEWHWLACLLPFGVFAGPLTRWP